MKNLEDFAKLLSSDLALAKKCIEANFDVETLKKLAAEKGFDLTNEELTPLASSLSIVMAKAKELKLSDEALASVAGGQKEGYDKPSSVSASGDKDGIFPLVIAALEVAIIVSSAVATAVSAANLATAVTAHK